MIALTLAIATQQTAEEWMAHAERAAREAQTMQVGMSFDFPGGPPATVEGDNRMTIAISLKRPNRFRMDAHAQIGGEDALYELRGDGANVGSRTQEPGGQPRMLRHNQPANIVPFLALSLVRHGAGFAVLFDLFESSREPAALPENIDELMVVRDLTLHGEEEIDGRRTVRLTFTLRQQAFEGITDEEKVFSETLWLDRETARPVRCTVQEQGEEQVITLHYERFEYGGETPDSDFDIPADWRPTDTPPDK